MSPRHQPKLDKLKSKGELLTLLPWQQTSPCLRHLLRRRSRRRAQRRRFRMGGSERKPQVCFRTGTTHLLCFCFFSHWMENIIIAFGNFFLLLEIGQIFCGLG